MTIESRMINRPLEVRKTDSGAAYIEGYAAVFYNPKDPEGTQFRLWDKCYERIMPGAFTTALSRPDDVRCLFNHDTNRVFGRTVAKTLTLSVDGVGLRFSCLLPATTEAAALAESIARGDVSGCSFSFRSQGVVWREEGDLEYREVNDVQLYDVGPVTFPAYTATDVSIAKRCLEQHRSASHKPKDLRAIERERRLSKVLRNDQ